MTVYILGLKKVYIYTPLYINISLYLYLLYIILYFKKLYRQTRVESEKKHEYLWKTDFFPEKKW